MLTLCAGIVIGSVLLAGAVIAVAVLDGREYPAARRCLLTINGKRFLEIRYLRAEQVTVFAPNGRDSAPLPSGDIRINLQAHEMSYALNEHPTVTH